MITCEPYTIPTVSNETSLSMVASKKVPYYGSCLFSKRYPLLPLFHHSIGLHNVLLSKDVKVDLMAKLKTSYEYVLGVVRFNVP